MDTSEIVRTARNTSFKDLVPISSIKTKRDVKRLNELGYSFVCTKGELKNEYPGLDVTHLYVTPNFLDAPCFYWDESSLIIFPVHLYGLNFMAPNSTGLQEYIQKGISSIRKKVENRNFIFLATSLNDRMRMEYLSMLIDKGLSSYKQFLTLYQISDYGCTDIGEERIRNILAKKTPEDIETTAKFIQSFPDIITVYRGTGTYSTGLDKAFSWTRNPGVAVFFATRLGSNNASIYQGTVKKADIIECLDGEEEEVLTMPGAVYNVTETRLYGLDWLAPVLQEISSEYHDYLDAADYETIPFQTSGTVHEKGHSMRVLLLCLILAQLYSLPIEDKDVLADAALYHDTGRSHDWVEDGHGAASAKLYEERAEYPNDISCFLIRYHCLPDAKGLEFIQKNFSADAEHIMLLFNIFKDADGLDRVRLGKNELDFTQLRTEEAKKLLLVANLILENVKIPEN